MAWRCLKDYFRYCNGTPEFEQEPQQAGTPERGEVYHGGICQLSPETCGKCLKNFEIKDGGAI